MKRVSCLVTVLFFATRLPLSSSALEQGLHELAASLGATLASLQVERLAVLNFVDIRGYDSALDHFIAEELTTQLLQAQPGSFGIVERRQLTRVLEEQQLTASALFDQDAIADVGKILGLDAIITGTVADLGTDVKINARAISVETALIVAAAATKVPKQGEVERLLHQGAAPGAAASQRPGRQVQASDVFFQNDLIRLTVGAFGVSEDREKASVSLRLENLSNRPLALAFPMRNSTGDCAVALSDEVGNSVFARRLRVGGIPCLYMTRREKEALTEISPASITTVTLPFTSREPLGQLFALSLEFVELRGGREKRFSAGLSNIEASR